MGKYTVRIASISAEGDSELWFYNISGLGDHAMYVSKGTTFDEAMAKILNVAAKTKGDSRIGKYELVKNKPPHKVASNDELEAILTDLKQRVEKLEKEPK